MIAFLAMMIGLAVAAPKISERDYHQKYFKKVYGENLEDLKDLKFWYGNRHQISVLTLPAGVARHSPAFQKFRKEKEQSYLPAQSQVKKVCSLKPGSVEASKEFIFCTKELTHSEFAKDFSPIYESPQSQARLVGFFNREKGTMLYRGEYVDLRPYEVPAPEGTINDRDEWPFLTAVLDYKISLENGVEREWMRLPTMGLPGEAWVGATDIEGPMPILDRQRVDKLTKGNKVVGLGLTQLSKTRLLHNSCYLGVEEGNVLFMQFLFPMNWNKSLRTNGPSNYHIINPEGPNIDIREDFVRGPLIAEYLTSYKNYPPLVFRMPLIDFFMGLGNQFHDVSQVAMSPSEADRKCDYSPEFFYKKIPKDSIVKFADRFGRVLLYGESAWDKTTSHEYQTTPFDDKDSSINRALRGEVLNDPFALYIYQIHKGE